MNSDLEPRSFYLLLQSFHPDLKRTFSYPISSLKGQLSIVLTYSWCSQYRVVAAESGEAEISCLVVPNGGGKTSYQLFMTFI